ncbi:MAG: rod shape-determining protein MreC [Bacilli bacterium]|nr:rod shape-determining protein MreC [Bacilli bacterium]
MKKKRSKIKYIVIGAILLFAILLGVTPHFIDEDKDLNFFEKALKDTSTFTQKIFYAPIKFVKDKVEMISETNDLYKKYTKLKEKVEKTDLYYAQIEELQKEVTELKSTLDLNATLSEYTYVNATVVNRNVGYWYNNLNIDKGSKNGIKKGDAVITPNGLIGKVTSVSNFSSTVKLLTSDEISNKISIKISSEDKHLYGLLIGYDKEYNVYKIEGITDSNSIKEGDLVTTTGLTDYFPSGILIGEVSRIVKDEYDLNSIVEVTPSVNFQDISTVTVLNRKAVE